MIKLDQQRPRLHVQEAFSGASPLPARPAQNGGPGADAEAAAKVLARLDAVEGGDSILHSIFAVLSGA